MKWGNYDLMWARPLKSILCIFNKKTINFPFYHIRSSNSSFLIKILNQKESLLMILKTIKLFFKSIGIIINQSEREQFIQKEFNKILSKKNLKIQNNKKLLEEVTDLTDCPNILLCSFDKRYLSIPREILILTMESHQKYFPLFNYKDEITNEFLVVANKKDIKGLIKMGNERVVEARLRDAEFFWNKDKSQNLVKKVSELNTMTFLKASETIMTKYKE